MDSLINMKNNLIQNFYILGFSPEDFFQLKKKDKGEFLNIFEYENPLHFNPKILSKFPPNNSNYNGINDEIIKNHCFPRGLTIINVNQKNKPPTHFEFELDNILIHSSIEEKNIFSKMYFSCLEIYEPIIKYFNYKNEIKEKKIEIINDIKETREKYKHIYIPKIICFASILPFYKELDSILNLVYKIYSNLEINNMLPIEKIIEQIVLSIPIPLMSNTHLELLFKLNNLDGSSGSLPDFYKVNFPLFNIKERNLRLYYTNPLSLIFEYFTPDDILKIYKSILLEIPILFFCEDKTILSSIIESFISLLSPFKYVHPYISILPEKFYGFIATEKKFLFGINEIYNGNFFYKNDIELDKNLIVVSISIYKDEVKIEDIIKQSEEGNNFFIIEDNDNEKSENEINIEEENFVTNDYVVYNGTKTDIINIELPNIKRKALYEDLNNFKSKLKSKKNEEEDDNNYKIQSFFYKFIVYLLAGYTDFYLNSKFFYESIKSKNCGNEILYKKDNDKGTTHLNFIKEIFDFEDFVYKSKDGQLFYYVFFQTKMFYNFLHERIYLNDKINSMAYKQFDQLTFLKKHEDYRKKKENKGVYEDFKKKPQDKSKKEKIKEISIEIQDFNEIEKEQIISKDKKTILLKYGQKIKTVNKKEYKLSYNYCIFPRLLFDDEFFNMKYENIFFMHGIDMPISRTLEDFKSVCSSYNDEYIKLRRYMFPPVLIDKLPSTNNSKVNFEVTSFYYIYFNWIILLCCSIWYCDPLERIARLDEILVVLDKLIYIEEIVLKLLFLTFLKYGNKIQCIKAHEKVTKFYGYSNYFFLNLLCNKLCEKEDDEKIKERTLYKKIINFENEDNKKKGKKYNFKDRSFILALDTFIKNRISTPNKSTMLTHQRFTRSTTNFTYTQKYMKKIEKEKIKENKYKERIVFSSEQFCPKCQCYYPFDFEEIKNQKLSKLIFSYKCSKCNIIKNDVTIKYQMLLYNKIKKELFITKMGEFKLLPPNRLYQELMYYLTSKKEWQINIENIFTEKQINLINFIYYFSSEGLSFDFLIPFKTLSDENVELIQNNLGAIISDINKRRFTLLEISEYDKINKSLTMNTDKEDFVPIDISNNDNLNRYYDLMPCLINYYNDLYEFNDNENEEQVKCNDENNNNNIIINDEGQSYFTINATKN